MRRFALVGLVALVALCGFVAWPAAPARAEELDAAALATIKEDVKSGDRAREQMALLRVGRASPRPAETVALCKAVLDKSVSALSRFYAAMVLATEPKGAAALLGALKDPSPDVRGMAAEALGVLKHKPAAATLKKVVATDVDDEVVAYAAWALVNIGAVDADALARRLEDLIARREPPRKARAREELRRVTGYGPLVNLEGGLTMLTRTLAKVATRDARDSFVAAAKHGNAEVRVAAAEALGAVAAVGDYEAVTTLEKLREDRDEGVRAAAMKALVSIGYAGKPEKK